MDMFVDVCVSKNQIRYKNPVLLWSTIAYTAADYVLILILIFHIICLGCTMLDWKNYQQQLRFFFSHFYPKLSSYSWQKLSDGNWKQNGILLPKLFWPSVRKKCSSDREKLLKFEAEGWEFAKYLRSLEQFIQTVKVQNNSL